jgi:hypothetical protein
LGRINDCKAGREDLAVDDGEIRSIDENYQSTEQKNDNTPHHQCE